MSGLAGSVIFLAYYASCGDIFRDRDEPVNPGLCSIFRSDRLGISFHWKVQSIWNHTFRVMEAVPWSYDLVFAGANETKFSPNYSKLFNCSLFSAF